MNKRWQKPKRYKPRVQQKSKVKKPKNFKIDKAQQETVQRAKKMMQELNIPFITAYQLVTGVIDYEKFMQKIERKRKIHELMRKEKLDGGLAGQVVDGLLTVEEAHLIKRWKAYQKTHNRFSILNELYRKRRDFSFYLFDKRIITGRVVKNEKYEFWFESGKSKEKIHKLLLKYGCNPKFNNRLKEVIKIDNKLSKLNLRPPYKIRERFRIKDIFLFLAFETRQEVILTLLSGEIFKGLVEWFSQWEIQLQLNNKISVVIFRHSLKDAKTIMGLSLSK